jgi:hypothetical protein
MRQGRLRISFQRSDFLLRSLPNCAVVSATAVLLWITPLAAEEANVPKTAVSIRHDQPMAFTKFVEAMAPDMQSVGKELGGRKPGVQDKYLEMMFCPIHLRYERKAGSGFKAVSFDPLDPAKP